MSTSDKQTKNLTTGTNVSAGGDSGNAEDLTVFVRFFTLKSLSRSLVEFETSIVQTRFEIKKISLRFKVYWNRCKVDFKKCQTQLSDE